MVSRPSWSRLSPVSGRSTRTRGPRDYCRHSYEQRRAPWRASARPVRIRNIDGVATPERRVPAVMAARARVGVGRADLQRHASRGCTRPSGCRSAPHVVVSVTFRIASCGLTMCGSCLVTAARSIHGRKAATPDCPPRPPQAYDRCGTGIVPTRSSRSLRDRSRRGHFGCAKSGVRGASAWREAVLQPPERQTNHDHLESVAIDRAAERHPRISRGPPYSSTATSRRRDSGLVPGSPIVA